MDATPTPVSRWCETKPLPWPPAPAPPPTPAPGPPTGAGPSAQGRAPWWLRAMSAQGPRPGQRAPQSVLHETSVGGSSVFCRNVQSIKARGTTVVTGESSDAAAHTGAARHARARGHGQTGGAGGGGERSRLGGGQETGQTLTSLLFPYFFQNAQERFDENKAIHCTPLELGMPRIRTSGWAGLQNARTPKPVRCMGKEHREQTQPGLLGRRH